MGAVNSKAGDAGALYLRDQTRCMHAPSMPLLHHSHILTPTPAPVSVASLNITNARNRTLLNVSPNAFPATRYTARRDFGDDSVVEYIQVNASSPPALPPPPKC